MGTTRDDYIKKINYIGKIAHTNKKNTPLFIIDKYGEIFYKNKKKLFTIESPLFTPSEMFITDEIRFHGKKNIVQSQKQNVYYIRLLMEMLQLEELNE